MSYATARAITPSDSVYLAMGATECILATVAGDVSVTLADGSTVVLPIGAGAGAMLPIRAVRVNATGTTATGLFGFK